MHILIFMMAAAFSFSAAAEERAAPVAGKKAQVIKLCANPETGEQIEYEAATAPSCPDGFRAYDDVTARYVERVENTPPPRPMTARAEQEEHAE